MVEFTSFQEFCFPLVELMWLKFTWPAADRPWAQTCFRSAKGGVTWSDWCSGRWNWRQTQSILFSGSWGSNFIDKF